MGGRQNLQACHRCGFALALHGAACTCVAGEAGRVRKGKTGTGKGAGTGREKQGQATDSCQHLFDKCVQKNLMQRTIVGGDSYVPSQLRQTTRKPLQSALRCLRMEFIRQRFVFGAKLINNFNSDQCTKTAKHQQYHCGNHDRFNRRWAEAPC